jgi:hypothetical protein
MHLVEYIARVPLMACTRPPQVSVLMALAVAREGKRPTALFGNLPGGSDLPC